MVCMWAAASVVSEVSNINHPRLVRPVVIFLRTKYAALAFQYTCKRAVKWAICIHACGCASSPANDPIEQQLGVRFWNSGRKLARNLTRFINIHFMAVNSYLCRHSNDFSPFSPHHIHTSKRTHAINYPCLVCMLHVTIQFLRCGVFPPYLYAWAAYLS